MKKSILILLSICFFLSGQNQLLAQKAKFKSKSAYIQKTRLPDNYIEPEKRTYDLYAQGSYSSQVDAHQKKIFGWKQDIDNPNVKGVVSIYGFSVDSPKVHSKKKTKKDDDGKVTDSWTEYHYTNSAKGRGTLYIYGTSNPFKYQDNDKPKKKSKYQEKQEAKAAADKKALADNPFLSSEDVEEAESDIGEDEGLDGEALPLLDRVSVDQTKEVKSKTFRSSSKAYADYKNNQRNKLYDFKSTYPNSAYRSAISRLNRMYGYAPVKERFSMKTMKTEKHPEYKTWNDACTAASTLFKTVKYNKSIDATSTKFDPIIKYFSEQVKKSNGDKKAKKLNKAAFKNLTNILFYLDRHDALIPIGKENLESKVLDKTAKRIVDKSKRLKAKLLFHKMKTCHVESAEEVAEDDIEVNEAEEDEDEESGN